jgi:hypothetical protein
VSWLSNLFKGNQKRDTTYTGNKPATSLTQVRGGQPYYDMIYGRTQGQDLGYGADYASKYASPIIKNSRNKFEGYTIPELKSELSATGRRRGSAGFDQMRRAYEQQGMTEDETFANLQMRNEDQMRNEKNSAISALGTFAQGEANMLADRAQFDYGDYKNQLATADAQREQGRTNTRALFDVGAQIAMAAAGIPTAPKTSTATPAYSSAYTENLMNRNPNYYQPIKYGQAGSVGSQGLKFK